MAFDVNGFYSDLIKDANLSDEQKALLQSTLQDPSVTKRLEEGQLRQSDYSKLAKKAQDEIKEALNYRNELIVWKQQEEERLRALSQAEGRGSEGRNPYQSREVQDNSKAELEELRNRLQSMEANSLGLMAVMNKKSFEYFRAFGKELDVDAVTKHAQENGLRWDIAYEQFTKPDVEAKNKVELEARIKQEREDAVKEALANANIPVAGNTFNPFSGGQKHVLDALKSEGAKFGWEAAAEAHMKDAMAGKIQSFSSI